jgi:hypothetical protein
MVTKIIEWASITALLMVVSWRPFASYQIPLDLVVCACAVMGFLSFNQTQNRDSLQRRLQAGPRDAGHCKLLSVVVLGATEARR